MALKYVFSETGTGLRRNVSMSVALIVTIFVSLTLMGLGLLFQAQVTKTEHFLGSRLQITVVLCNQNSQSANCSKANVTPTQKQGVTQVLKTNPEVASYYWRSKDAAYKSWKQVYLSNDQAQQKLYDAVTPNDMQETYWVTLKDPRQFAGLESQLQGMPGVDYVRDMRQLLSPVYTWMGIFKWGAIGFAAFLVIAAILEVVNTIRLATIARRKELGIMRLVGASTLYISLPFLMEMLVATLIGVVLSGAALAALTYFGVYGRLRGHLYFTDWVTWHDTLWAFGWSALAGILLTIVPTLLVTRKYINV